MSKKRKLTEFFTSSTKKSKTDAEQQTSKSNAPNANNDTQENLQYSPEIEGNKQFHPPETFPFPKRHVLANLEGLNFKNFLARSRQPWWRLLRYYIYLALPL